jgi:hypothetical protein
MNRGKSSVSSGTLKENDLKSVRDEAPLPHSMIHEATAIRKQKRKIRFLENGINDPQMRK